MIKSWSRPNPILCLSSGEAELAAMVRAAAEGFGLRAFLRDFDCDVRVLVKSDASAAIGMCKRQGLGKVRHLVTADLWIQQRVRSKELTIRKWPGKDNPSDVLTKPVGSGDMRRLLADVGIIPLEGRAASAPKRAAMLPQSLGAETVRDEGGTDEEDISPDSL